MTENNRDLDGDGVVEETELAVYLRKLRVQRRMAVASFIFIPVYVIAIVAMLATGILNAEEVSSLTGLSGLFITGMFGVVATYFGVEYFLSKK